MSYEGPLRAEHQIVEAGSQFDGQGASKGYNDNVGTRKFRPDAQGGLMDLAPHTDAQWPSNRVRRVMSVKLKMGGQSAWTISVASPDHPDIEWLSGTVESDFIHDEAEGVIHLAPNERLKITTTGATDELHAHVIYELSGDQIG